MNNISNLSRKLRRNNLEQSVLSSIKRQYPNVQQYISQHRYPIMPKIIVYSAAASSESFLRKIFPFYNIITPSLSTEGDETIAKRIAHQLTQVNQEQHGTELGYFVRGFPFNANQALLLDRYLNGVNLALLLKSKSQSGDYLSSIEPLLKYYNQRGTLLELEYNQEPTADEIDQFYHQIKIKIKRSF